MDSFSIIWANRDSARELLKSFFGLIICDNKMSYLKDTDNELDRAIKLIAMNPALEID